MSAPPQNAAAPPAAPPNAAPPNSTGTPASTDGMIASPADANAPANSGILGKLGRTIGSIFGAKGGRRSKSKRAKSKRSKSKRSKSRRGRSRK